MDDYSAGHDSRKKKKYKSYKRGGSRRTLDVKK